MINLDALQLAIAAEGCDGWLLCDFRNSNPLSRRVLKFPDAVVGSRRWAYLIPAVGEPRKLVHRIEPGMLDDLPGSMKTVYLSGREFEAGMAELLAGRRRVAMEYSPRNRNPYIARVDAGLVELVRACGVDVVSSGDLVQQFEATWDDEQWVMHQQAAEVTNAAYGVAWSFIAERVRGAGETTEVAVQNRIMDHFHEHGLTTYHPPIVGVNANSGDPHYDTGAKGDFAIREGDFVLVDLWAKLDCPRAVYSDLTRVGYVGAAVPAVYQERFSIVARARDAAIERVRSAFAQGFDLRGRDVDLACREVIEAAGFGPQFSHRTGHSIGQEVHGNGANMDSVEIDDERRVLPRTCFSIEPGIYLPDFGVRSEVNVFVDAIRHVHVTGGELQYNVVPILA